MKLAVTFAFAVFVSAAFAVTSASSSAAGDGPRVSPLATKGDAPHASDITIDGQFDYEAPAHSLTVIRVKTR